MKTERASKRVILGITGSIAAYKACDIINRLTGAGIEVEIVMTKEAEEFITPLTLQTLSRNKVMRGMFELPDEWNPQHIAAAERADAVLIAPACANIIGKLASGVTDDMLTCLVYATKAPVLIAPAMNANMYRHEVVQENIAKLKKVGYKFIGPVKGRLACGCDDVGHIAAVDDIVDAAKKLLR